MFDRRNILAALGLARQYADEDVVRVVAAATGKLSENIARRGTVQPFRIFRGAADLNLTRLAEVMTEWHQLGACGIGLGVLESMTRDARPFVYPLVRSDRDGRAVDRVAVAGAFRTPGAEALKTVTVMTWEVAHDAPGVLQDVDVWDWDSNRSTTELTEKFEHLFSETHPDSRRVFPSESFPQQAVLYLPPGTRRELPPSFDIEAQAAAAGAGFQLRIASTASDANNLIQASGAQPVQIYVGWARFERYDTVSKVRDFFDVPAPSPRVMLRLVAYPPVDALAELREVLERTRAEGVVPAHSAPLNADGWYYLEKSGGGGGRDAFSSRAGPCRHNAWYGADSKAPQARSGACHFFGSMNGILRTLRAARIRPATVTGPDLSLWLRPTGDVRAFRGRPAPPTVHNAVSAATDSASGPPIGRRLVSGL